jgi:hypothetical protein
MPIEYILNTSSVFDTVFQEVKELSEFSEFHANNIRVGLMFKCASKGNDGELVESRPAVKLVKCPAIWRTLRSADTMFDYVVLIDRCTWDGSSQTDRKRLIHLGLSSLQITVKDDGGFTAKNKVPDVVTYRKTVDRFGLFSDERDALHSAITRGGSVVADMLVTGALGAAGVAGEPVREGEEE